MSDICIQYQQLNSFIRTAVRWSNVTVHASYGELAYQFIKAVQLLAADMLLNCAYEIIYLEM